MEALAAVTLSALLIFLVKVPLYNTLNVTFPHKTYRESVGIPMTILGDTLVKNQWRFRLKRRVTRSGPAMFRIIQAAGGRSATRVGAGEKLCYNGSTSPVNL
jgi:hypothetical protein